MGKNLNFKNWGNSINKLFGGGKKNAGPPPNTSKYVNLQRNNFSDINTTSIILPNSNGLSKEQWEDLPLLERLFTDRPGLIGGSGGLGFVSGEAEILLAEKVGQKLHEVYHLVNKETQVIEYVGKTSQGILKRFNQHLLDPSKQTWIHNVEPVLYKSGLTRFQAKYYEQTEILSYKIRKFIQ